VDTNLYDIYFLPVAIIGNGDDRPGAVVQIGDLTSQNARALNWYIIN